MDNAPRKTLKVYCPGCQRKLDVTDIPAFSAIHCPMCEQKIVVPKPFANFLLEEVIGQSPMATVYRGHDLTLDREIAVRIVSDAIRRSPEAVAQFLAQARKIAALIHPTVMPIYACGEFEGWPYLTMQFMPNFNLARHWDIPEQSIAMEFCIDTMLAIATALDKAWSQGILHHHLSPGNILLDEDMNVKTADFGLAYASCLPQVFTHDQLCACNASSRYISPEKGLTGKQDARGDIYSLGAISYHLLTGQPPFTGDFSREEFEHRISIPVPTPKIIRPEIPEILSRLVTQMLAASPENRPQAYPVIISELEILKRAGKQPPLLGRRKKSVFRASPSRAGVFTTTRDLGPTLKPGFRPPPAVRHKTNTSFALAMLLCLAALLAVIIIAGIRRARWYVNFLEPLTAPLVQQLEPQANAPVTAPTAAPLPANIDIGQGLVLSIENGADGGGEDSGDRGRVDQNSGESPVISLPAPTVPPEAGITSVKTPVRALSATLRAARPKPADLNFFRVESALRAYLKRVPAVQRKRETDRIRELSTLRQYLLQLMRFVPYDDEKRGVMLGNGTVLRGSAFASAKEIVVRQHGDKYRKVSWDDLAFQQIINFFEFYINMRLSHASSTTADGSMTPNKKEAAGDAYRIALLCDWYDQRAAAARFARAAMNWDPQLSPRIRDMLPGEER